MKLFHWMLRWRQVWAILFVGFFGRRWVVGLCVHRNHHIKMENTRLNYSIVFMRCWYTQKDLSLQKDIYNRILSWTFMGHESFSADQNWSKSYSTLYGIMLWKSGVPLPSSVEFGHYHICDSMKFYDIFSCLHALTN